MHTTICKAMTLALGLVLPVGTVQAEAPSAASVLSTYAEIAEATFADSFMTAEALDRAIDALIAAPSKASLAAAREAWIAARVPYQQSEVYRFGNAIVDDWEGRVNAWPLDEGLIDYVDAVYGDASPENRFYTVNVIASPSIQIGGRTIDASEITPALLQDRMHEVGGIEANVATGYHAIEFLLWGQDLNGTGPGAGDRPHGDFDPADCSGGNCERRNAYLKAASRLLLTDLQEMVTAWGPLGAARDALFEKSAEAGILTMLTGMGSLSYGELAGERMKLGLLLHDPEEEQDCFSDNTHNAHYHAILGIQNVYLGRYTRVDGSLVSGAALSDHVASFAPDLDRALKTALGQTLKSAEAMVARAAGGEAYDQMIGPGNTEGNAVVQAVIEDLIQQTRSIEDIVVALDIGQIEIEGSDSLDDPNAVFH